MLCAESSKYLARYSLARVMQILGLLQLFCSSTLIIHLANGQCRTDCRCVPPQPAPGGENRCCLSIRENQPPGSLVGNANQLALIADFMPTVYEFTPIDPAGTLLNLNRTTGAITTVASIDREAIDCLEFVVRVRAASDVPLATPG